MSKPKDTFTTRSGKTIALKPWTFELIAEHADSLRRYISTWIDVLSGNPEADLGALKDILPTMKASVQSEDSLGAVEGLSEMADLALAIWQYNEVGIGLGKFAQHQMTMHQEIQAAIEPRPSPAQEVSQNPQ